MSVKSILKYFGLFVVFMFYLWFIGEAFAHISVYLAFGLIILGILSLIIYFRKFL